MALPVVSGKDVIRVLSKLGFYEVNRKGDHIILKRDDVARFHVPLHKELKRGTLKHILNNAGVSREQFIQTYENL